MDTLQQQLEAGLAGRYRLERELGQGGMAVKARQWYGYVATIPVKLQFYSTPPPQ